MGNKTVEEKAFLLAELMGWEVYAVGKIYTIAITEKLNPYDSKSNEGLSQFAAILLKFPEVMRYPEYFTDDERNWIKPTQSQILDTILEMNGVEL